MQTLPIFPDLSHFYGFPRLSCFCADFAGGLKKNGISCSKDDYLCVNYIVLALIWVVIHIFTICGSKVMKFWKFVGIFGKSGQNRGKISIKSGKSNFFGMLFPLFLWFSITCQVFLSLAWFFAILEGGWNPPPSPGHGKLKKAQVS